MSTDSAEFCSFGARSYTLPTTNHTFIAGLQLPEHLPSLRALALPPELLLSFVHEATHRWCFRMRVGSALAILSLRARRRTLAGLMDGLGAPSAPDVDAFKYATTLAYLRPLAEGIALFAELDTEPGLSKATSEPISWASILFAGHAVAAGRGDEAISRLLTRQRGLTWTMRQRLYADPFDASRGGYLVGYLAVRALWMRAARRAPKFRDKSLFLALLIEYFWGDPELTVALLSAGERDDFVAWLDIHLRARFAAFGSDQTAEWADSFETWLCRHVKGSIAPCHDGVAAQQVALARGMILAAFDQLKNGGNDFESLFGLIDLGTLVRREVMWLGEADGYVRAGANERSAEARFDDDTILNIESTSTKVREGNGTISAFFVPEETFVGLAAHVETELVGLGAVLGKVTDRLRERYERTLTPGSVARATDVVMHALVKGQLHKTTIGGAMQSALDEASARSADAHSEVWLSTFPRRKPDVITKLRGTGLRGVIDDCVEGLALFSTCYSLGADAALARKAFATYGRDYDADFSTVCRRTEREFGKSLVHEMEGVILSLA